MTYTTKTLVSNVVHGTPSGNYDGGNSFVSDVIPAASYYAGQGSVQTITYQLNGFVGNITMKATLNDSQESAPYFTIATQGDGTGTFTSTVVGNFTWIVAEITDFTAGTIGSITVAY